MHRLIGVLGLAGLLLGCDGVEAEDDTGVATDGVDTQNATSEGSGAMPGIALLLVEIDAQAPCNTAGVTQVQLTAVRTGCESPSPAPCTLPSNPVTLEGEVLSCPSSDATRVLGIELDTAGRYAVQTVTSTASAEQEGACHAFEGDAEILIRAADLEPGLVRMLDEGTVACD